MRPKKTLSVAQIIGYNIKKYRMKRDKPQQNVRLLADKVGVTHTTWYRWENGEVVPEDINQIKIADALGIAMYDLRYGIDNELPSVQDGDSLPSNNAAIKGPVDFILEPKGVPVVGEAAADETEGYRSGFFPNDAEQIWGEITIPETTAFVKIIGDSMSPVMLDGQYAFIGPEYYGSHDHPRDYDIVVASVEIRDEDHARSDQRWEGVYCKRIVDAGSVWVFLSINQTGQPFTVAKTNCRLWPVIGVWFAGKGRPPVGD